MLTEAILEQGKSRNGAWGYRQLKLLGVRIPLRQGWKERIIGRLYPDDVLKQFVEMKDRHIEKREKWRRLVEEKRARARAKREAKR